MGKTFNFAALKSIHKHPNSSYGIYSHMGGKLVVVVEIEGASDQEGIAKEIAMHVAAENPDYLKPEEIPAACDCSRRGDRPFASGRQTGKYRRKNRCW